MPYLFANSVEGIQLYALLFLLGSLTVAALSDLRRMAAQKEFAEFWILFTGIILVYEIAVVSGEYSLTNPFLVKWILIGVISALSFTRFLFRFVIPNQPL